MLRVLSVQTLTTNITGHFAYFAEEIMKRDYAANLFLYSLSSFLFGAFFFGRINFEKHPNLSHVIPIALEMIVLIGVGFFNHHCLVQRENGLLLRCFAMNTKLFGNKNFSIYRPYNPFNRTFTDLGIELSVVLL
jgi:branched-subunit amino acid permease